MTIPSEAKVFKDKECLICKNPYTPTGCSSKYCKPCAKEHWRNKAAAYQQEHRIRTGKIKKPGVGKGGNNGSKETHNAFKNGLGCNFQDQRKQVKEEKRYCERCNKDLIEATRYQWCIHHKDHTRNNNEYTNFELLCKRCHQIEHECHKAFGTCND